MPSNRSQMRRDKLRREALDRARDVSQVLVEFGKQAAQLEINFSHVFALRKPEGQLAEELKQSGQIPIIRRGDKSFIPWRHLPPPYGQAGILLVEVTSVTAVYQSQAS